MWTDEVIFSEGDLCDLEDYHDFILTEYDGNYSDRLSHVLNMIKRLEVEKSILLSDPSELPVDALTIL